MSQNLESAIVYAHVLKVPVRVNISYLCCVGSVPAEQDVQDEQGQGFPICVRQHHLCQTGKHSSYIYSLHLFCHLNFMLAITSPFLNISSSNFQTILLRTTQTQYCQIL